VYDKDGAQFHTDNCDPGRTSKKSFFLILGCCFLPEKFILPDSDGLQLPQPPLVRMARRSQEVFVLLRTLVRRPHTSWRQPYSH